MRLPLLSENIRNPLISIDVSEVCLVHLLLSRAHHVPTV